ncbi:GGDEF domain-containing protein [Vibrio albus]|uniref:diguanylate cyclase n=1 Tax=Vibrio albus TaxID=2200953 RepID=A0A2U3B761_9VIBR|nr:GGDEF domain-containing protein [Vibrio albus]PWI32643.1 GGDEF domain-containing protein [Vibrio albus]
MNKEEFQKSTENLRKAVPLMIKNQVPTTPTNYALWYTYVDEAQPELNLELDKIVTEYGLCPPSSCEYLYKHFIADKAETDVQELRSNLEILVNEIFMSMKDTLANTQDFQDMLDKHLGSLEQVDRESVSFEEVIGLLQNFVSESHEIKNSTHFFHQQLNNASKEITELKQQLEKVQKDALYDSLSSLLNRGAFDRDLATMCQADKQKLPLCLILLDIDRFKDLNDKFGHVFGDMVIKAIAKRLQLGCREGITAYRYGGEEFALLVPNKSLRSAIQFADSIRRSIEKISIKDKRTGEQVENISASFGVAELNEGEQPINLIDNADQQLYQAKSLGRNRVMPV